jgi:hypothetical protein
MPADQRSPAGSHLPAYQIHGNKAPEGFHSNLAPPPMSTASLPRQIGRQKERELERQRSQEHQPQQPSPNPQMMPPAQQYERVSVHALAIVHMWHVFLF